MCVIVVTAVIVVIVVIVVVVIVVNRERLCTIFFRLDGLRNESHFALEFIALVYAYDNLSQ